MPIRVSASGQTFEFPDGTSEDVIRSSLLRHFADNPEPEPEKGFLERAKGAVSSVVDSVMGDRPRKLEPIERPNAKPVTAKSSILNDETTGAGLTGSSLALPSAVAKVANKRGEDVARRAQEDVVGPEDSWSELGRKFFDRIGPLVKQSVGGIGQALTETSGYVPVGTPLSTAESAEFQGRIDEALQIARDRKLIPGQKLAEVASEDLRENGYNFGDNALKKYPAMIAESVVQMLPSIAASVATRNPSIAGLVTAGQVGGSQYAESREAGRDRGAALGDSVVMGAAEAIGEKIPVGILMKPGGKFLPKVLKAMGAESLQETFTQTVQSLYDKGVLHPEMTWGEVRQQVIDAAIVGGGMGGSLAVGFGAFDATGRIAGRRADDTRTPGPGIREQAISQAGNLTPEDLASPLDNADIVAGRTEIANATAGKTADNALSQAGLPKVGSKVNVSNLPGGNSLTGTIEDVFSDENGDGVVVRPEGGGKPMREYLDTLNELGVSITPSDALAEADAIDAALAAQASAPMEVSSPLPSAGAEVAPSSPSGRTPSASAGGATNFDIGSYMARVRQAESGGKDNAKAGTSSATGRYQFTDGTWLTTYKAVFGNTGENDAQILAKRGDGAVQDRLMQKLTQDNAAALRAAGLPVNDTTLYLAHFAGVGGARSILKVAPERSVETVLGKKAVAANSFLKGKTAGEVIAWAAGKMGAEGGGGSGTVYDGPSPAAEKTDWYEPPAEQAEQKLEVTAPAPELPQQEATSQIAEGNEIRRVRIGDIVQFAEHQAGTDGQEVSSERAAERERIRDYIKSNGSLPGGRPLIEIDTKRGTAQIRDGNHRTVLGNEIDPNMMVDVEVRRRDTKRPHSMGVPYEGQLDSKNTATGGDMAGQAIDKEWTAFAPDSGTIGIPRAEMPQVKAEHRGAMVNFLNARGISHAEEEVAADTLKPSQAEFSPSKVEKAKRYEGGNRAILISADGYVVDGHHQWLAARDKRETVRAIRLNAPIREVLQAAHEFPSSETADGATSTNTAGPQDGEIAPTVEAPKAGGSPATAADSAASAGGAVTYDADPALDYDSTPRAERVRIMKAAGIGSSMLAGGPERNSATEFDRLPSAVQQRIADYLRQNGNPAVPFVQDPEGGATTPARVEDTGTGKSVAVIGASEAEIAAISAAVPKAMGMKRKDGALVYSKKYADKIRTALDGVTKTVTPAEAAPSVGQESQTLTQAERKALESVLRSSAKGGEGWAKDSSAGARAQEILDAQQTRNADDAKLLETAMRLEQRRQEKMGAKPKEEALVIRNLRTGEEQSMPLPPENDPLSPRERAQLDSLKRRNANGEALDDADMVQMMDLDRKAKGQEESDRPLSRNEKIIVAQNKNRAAGTDQTLAIDGDGNLYVANDGYMKGGKKVVASASEVARDIDAALAKAQVEIDRRVSEKEQQEEPSVSQEAKPAPAPEPTKNRLVTDERAAELRERLKAKLNPGRLNSGIDPEIIAIGTELAVYHIEKGARRFQAFASAIAADLGMKVQDLRLYMRGWYNGARDMMEDAGESVAGMDTPDEVAKSMRTLEQWANERAQEPSATPSPTPAESSTADPVTAVRDFFLNGGRFATIVEARKFLSEQTGEEIRAGTPEAKRADETIEAAVVQAARTIAARNEGNPLTAYRELVDLYQRQPNLSVRSSTSVEQQAYSTPVPLAYLASRRAGIDQNTTVYEPTAGNGALLIDARATYVTANELNPDRNAQLRAIYRGAKITQEDASSFTPPGAQRDVVIANPPFGVVKDADGEARTFNMGDGYVTREIDHAISLMALDSMKNDGKAVLIVGSINKQISTERGRADAYNAKAKREFYYRLYNEYNVTDHFTVAGELYAKQGAGWPVDVIVIKGRGKSALPLPAVKPPRQFDSWATLETEVERRPSVQPATGAAPGNLVEQGAEPARSDGRDSAGSGSGRTDRLGQPTAAQQPGDVRAGSPDPEPNGGRLDAVASRNDAKPAADNGNRADRRTPQVKREAVAGENARQVTYQPASGAKSLDTLVPVNMQTAISNALGTLQDRVGAVDSYVADRLGFDEKDIATYFSAEQVDALALAIDNMERGAGFIIGDQTGIGKGRVVAGVIRYALRSGRMPIFVTEKPNLYADMYRDMNDVGIPKMLGRPVDILMTNAAEKVPLNEDGSEELKTGPATKHNAILNRVADGDRAGVDVLFTTYAQMQSFKGEITPRQRAIERLASGSIIIFDESHNAGGQGKGAQQRKPKKKDGEDAGPSAPNRAEFARQIAKMAHGVFFSSATYAKRPDVMDLYASTDMRHAVSDIDKLGDAISKGGIPMQQVVASMLTEAGQYVRRERSFEGVEYRTPPVQVDRESYSQFTGVLRAIQDFQEQHIADAVETIADDIRAEAQAVSFDGSVGSAGATSTNFTSVMHNVVEQMLLAMKAAPAAARAIELLQEGKKPVITMANTMGSFIKEYADENNIGPNQPMPIDFRSLLIRYLDRTREINIKRPFSKEKAEKRWITDEELGGAGAQAYRNVREQIEAMDLAAVPVSPVDYIRNEIIKAGYRVGEITGRTATLDYSTKTPRYRIRPGKETSILGRREAITGFNSGTIDAMILNQAGSTGLSLHASATFKDKRTRVMIIAQAERNIDTHMQMLGRIHRTGQVVLPEYDQLVAAVPAEMRPAAVLAKKMASLNANTTGARDSAMTGEDVPDFMNEYGDEIAARMMEEDDVLHKRLGTPLSESDGEKDGYKREDAARKVTGRLMLLPLEEQEAFYDNFLTEYRDYLAQKEAAGEATLEAKTLDLDAKVLASQQVVEPTQPNTPFGEAVNQEVLDVKRLGKPLQPDQIMQDLEQALGPDRFPSRDAQSNMAAIDTAGSQWMEEFRSGPLAEFDAYRRETLDGMDDAKVAANAERLQANLQAFNALASTIHPGATVQLVSPEGDQLRGVVLSVEKKGNPKNPLALGAYRATFAFIEATGRTTIPFSQLRTDRMPESAAARTVYPIRNIDGVPVMQAFSEMQVEAREKRVFLTGNILAAYEHTGNKGQIVNFVDSEGAVRPGLMMRRGWDYQKEMAKRPVPFRTAEQVMAWLEEGETALADNVKVERIGNRLIVTAAAAKSVGGKFFLDKGVLSAVGGDFYKKSTGMVAETTMDKARAVITALQSAGATFTAKTNLDRARDIVAGGGKRQSIPEASPTASPTTDVSEALREQLANLRLADKVKVRLVDTLGGAAGEYRAQIVTIAQDTPQGEAFTLNHEAIHVLRDLGLFNTSEWAILSAKARRETGLMRSIRQRYEAGFRQRSMSGAKVEEALIEEAVADMFARHQEGRYKAEGTTDRLFKMLRQFFEAVRNAFAGRGLRTAEGVMQDVAAGEIGGRNDQGILDSSEAKFAIPERDDLVALGGTEPTWKGKAADAFDRWRTAMQDRYLPLLKVQRQIEEQTGKSLPVSRNPYMGEELMTGRIGARLERLAEEHVQPLFDAMHAEKITTEELESFLYARHAPERNARIAEINPEFTEGEGSGMTDLEAAAIMSRVRKAGKMEAMERLAKRVDQIRDDALDYRVQTGLISKADADEWRSTYQFYVPLRGFKETGTDAIPERMNRSGGGINVRGRESKQAFGRRSQADSPLAYLILQAEEAIIRGETNIVAARFYNLAKANPDKEFWSINKPTVRQRMNEESGLVESYTTYNLLAEDKDWTVSAKLNGREVRVTMNKENLDARRLADAMRNLTQHQLDWVTLHMGKVNRFLSAVNTSYNPEFIITNAFRDLQTATFNLSGEGVKGIVRGTLKDYRKALAASAKGAFGKQSGEWGKWYDEFVMNGGRVYFNKVENVEEIKKRIASAAEMAKAKAGEGGPRLQAKRLFLAGRDMIENLNSGVENAVRLSVYKNAREAGLTPAQAASMAKNVTVNFNRRGTAGPAMNAAYLFFNASVQGSARILMALRSPRVRKMVAGVMIAAAAAEMLNAMMTGDDDDGESFYDKIPAFEKSRNIVLMLPDGKSYIKIPMPYGYNAFWEAGRSAAEIARRGGDRWLETMGQFVGTVADAFNPIGGSDSLLNILSPTITDPIVDLTLNKDFTGKPIMPNQSPYGPEEPDNQRYFNSVGPHWKAVTDFFNTATGGDEVQPGFVDVSPETLEYLSGTVIGSAGAFLDRTLGLLTKSMDETEDVTANDIPIARKVVGGKPGWVDKAAFYDRLGAVETAMDRTEKYLEAGNQESAFKYAMDNKAALMLEGAAKQARKDMRDVRKARNELETAKERGQIDDATYREKKALVRRAEDLVTTEFNTQWNATMKAIRDESGGD